MLTFDDIISQMDKVQVMERYAVGLCPFHDDSKPSMLVFKDGWFRCLGCGRNGRWESLYRKLRGVTTIVQPEPTTAWRSPFSKHDSSSREEVAYQANEDLMRFPSYAWYLEMRHVESCIEPQALGYWKGWYSVPIFRPEGEFVNVVFRAAPHIEQATGTRYHLTGKTALYSPDWRRVMSSPVVFMVYGIFDALTLATMGLPVVSPPNGVYSMRILWLDDMRKPIVIVPDRDEEGFAWKHAAELGWRGNVLMLPYEDRMKDPNDFLVAGRGESLMKHLHNASNRYLQENQDNERNQRNSDHRIATDVLRLHA